MRGHGHHECVAKSGAPPAIPGNAEPAALGRMQGLGDGKRFRGGPGRRKARRFQQVRPVNQKFGGAQKGNAVLVAPSAGTGHGIGQEIGDIHFRLDDEIVERAQATAPHHVPEPGQIAGNDVIGRGRTLSVLDNFGAQAVDGQRFGLDRDTQDHLELALERVHGHECRIRMDQQAQSARQSQLVFQHGGRRDDRSDVGDRLSHHPAAIAAGLLDEAARVSGKELPPAQ